MRTQDRQPSGPRSSRGGSRRRRSSGSGRSNQGHSSNGNSSSGRSGPGRKQSLWDKIVAFFTGRKPAAPRPGRRTEREERPERDSRPERSESLARSARKPEVIEVSSPKLYVGNLSFDATESDLFDLFNGVGKVQSAEIVSHKYTEKSKGFAFVIMATVDEAKRAVTELHDKEFMGRKLVVSGAKTSDVRTGGNFRE